VRVAGALSLVVASSLSGMLAYPPGVAPVLGVIDVPPQSVQREGSSMEPFPRTTRGQCCSGLLRAASNIAWCGKTRDFQENGHVHGRGGQSSIML
jgi:hypothetical protein